MPVIYNTITEEMLSAMEQAVQECETLEFASLFHQFRLYQDNRLKINKESRESKMAARKEGGGGAKRGASAKMTGVVKLVAIEGQENTFKVEKVSIPVAPKIAETEPEEEDADKIFGTPHRRFTLKKAAEPEEEEEDISNNPEALAAAVAEAAARAAAPKPKAERKKRVPAPKKLVLSQASQDAVEECD